MQSWRRLGSLLVAIMAGAQVSIAEDTAKSDGFIDRVVRDVELAQHEKLIKAQSAPGRCWPRSRRTGAAAECRQHGLWRRG